MEATVAVQCVESVRHRVAMVAVDTRNIAREQDHLVHLIFSDYAKRLRRLAGLLKALQQDLEVTTTSRVSLGFNGSWALSRVDPYNFPLVVLHRISILSFHSTCGTCLEVFESE
jgi:hypothetical protein